MSLRGDGARHHHRRHRWNRQPELLQEDIDADDQTSVRLQLRKNRFHGRTAAYGCNMPILQCLSNFCSG